MAKMQGAEDEGAGSVLKYMTKPESDSNEADWLLCHTASKIFHTQHLFPALGRRHIGKIATSGHEQSLRRVAGKWCRDTFRVGVGCERDDVGLGREPESKKPAGRQTERQRECAKQMCHRGKYKEGVSKYTFWIQP